MKKLLFLVLIATLIFSCGTTKNTNQKNTQSDTKVVTINKDKLIGDWQLESVSGVTLTEREKTAVVSLNANGSGYSGNKESKIQWSVSEYEGKSLLIFNSEDDDQEKFEIKTIDDTKLILLERKEGKLNELVLKKIKQK